MVKNNDYLYIDKNDNTHQTRFKVSKTPKVENLIDEGKYLQALSLIDEILENDDKDFNNWKLKAVILDNLSDYDKSIECYDNALKLNSDDEILSKKAESLYRWAKVTFFPECDYEKAFELINESLKILPESEDASEHYFLKAEILEALRKPVEAKKAYLIAYKEFEKLEELEKQTEYLDSTDNDLINITGTGYYDFTPQDNQVVDLVEETDNEHDPDAIAVFLNGNKVGYVANSPYTVFKGMKSASEIKKSNPKRAVILFKYMDEYIIAKLLF